jgi:hypothetical protein
MKRPLRILAVLVCAGFVAAACGKSTPPSLSATTTTHHIVTTTSTTSAPTTTTSTAAAAGAGGTDTCGTITATLGQTQGAAGTVTGTVNLVDTGGTVCTMEGYPSLAMFGSGGAPIPTNVVDGLSVNISSAANGPPASITVSPDQGADFTYQYSDVPSGSETPCPSSVTVSFRPPGSSTSTAPIPLVFDACDGGTVRVSPVYMGG